MKASLGRVVIGAALLVAWQSPVWAQLGTLNRSAPLQSDASKSGPTVEHLKKGERVMLLATTPRAGYYHVRTEDEEVGWVWSKFVDISQSPHAPGQPTKKRCRGVFQQN